MDRHGAIVENKTALRCKAQYKCYSTLQDIVTCGKAYPHLNCEQTFEINFSASGGSGAGGRGQSPGERQVERSNRKY